MEKLLYLEVSEDRIEAIRNIIVEVLQDSGAKCGLLIDLSGHLLIRKGFTLIQDIENLCVLLAAQRATTREIAQILGQEDLSVIFHQGSGDHISIFDVGNLAIFALLFDDRAEVATLQAVASERTADIAGHLIEGGEENKSDISSIQNLQAQADKSLDRLLGPDPAPGGQADQVG